MLFTILSSKQPSTESPLWPLASFLYPERILWSERATNRSQGWELVQRGANGLTHQDESLAREAQDEGRLLERCR